MGVVVGMVVKHQRSGVLSATLLEHRQGSCFMT